MEILLDFLHYNVENCNYMNIQRNLILPKTSFMLLGPRGVGKSTLINQELKFELEISLLQSKYFLPLKSNPSLLEEWTKGLKEGAWIFIDEVQKIPALLDEVHHLYEKRKFNFALSGSSARKLKKEGVNLLAGRTLSVALFPLTFFEYKEHFSIDECIHWGSLPRVVTDKENRVEYLSTYVENYLRQELMEEGAIRKLEPFVRFLEVCGMYHGQVLNIENIARESYVNRTNIDNYFKILEDTLLGYRLEPFKPGWNRNEFGHSKFYLFDSGVARGCANWLRDDLDNAWLGFSFESVIINEVRAYNKYLKSDRKIYYYKYSSGYEIDLVIEEKKKTISQPQRLTAIEIKLAKKWDKRWNENLLAFKKDSKGKISKLIGVYRGKETLTQADVTIYPVEEFLLLLSQGEFF